MVSELSARLMMRGQTTATTISPTASINGSSSRNNYGAKSFYSDSTSSSSLRSNVVVVSPTVVSEMAEQPTMSISACTEKLSQIIATGGAGAPRTSTKRHSSRRRGDSVCFSSSHMGCFKRRKIDELQFAASRVHMDLARGGLSFPALDFTLRHHLDDFQVQTRGIQRLCSTSVSASPFLTTTAVEGGVSCSSQATMDDLESLVSATYDAYSKPSSSSANNNHNNGDGSSICSSTSDTTTESSVLSIPPLLEQALLSKATEATAAAEKKSAAERAASTPETDALYANPISIREAFENTCEARYVILTSVFAG